MALLVLPLLVFFPCVYGCNHFALGLEIQACKRILCQISLCFLKINTCGKRQ